MADDAPYSKREMDFHFKTLGEKIAARDRVLDDRLTKQDNLLVEIKAQTTKTNGRVNKHDWQIKAAWTAAGIIGGLLIFLLPYIFKLINKVNQLNYTITSLTEDYEK